MADKTHENNNILVDWWNSFRALPGWVQIWVALILAPVNMASLFFIHEPMGLWVAFLANIAMLLNLPVLLVERGFSKLMAFPHIIPWTILVIIILFYRPQATGLYDTYLWVLLGVNIISLIFDYPDAIAWWKGERKVAGRAS